MKGGLVLAEFLYKLVELTAIIHNRILDLNNGFEQSFTDKELHFLILGLLGIVAVFIIHPIFTWLARNEHTIVITFIYVFTLMIVLAFAIEIGQGLTGTGVMEFADIVYGIAGFLIAFLIFLLIRGLFKLITGAIKKHRK